MRTDVVVLAYLAGVVAGLVTLADIRRRPRRAFRMVSASRRVWSTTAIVAAATGIGGVVVAIVWFAGGTRDRVVDVTIDLEAEAAADERDGVVHRRPSRAVAD